MARTQADSINLIRQVLTDQDTYWDQLRPDMNRYRRVYLTRFWEGLHTDDTQLRVETYDAYAFIQSFIASLFTRAPAVEVSPDGDTPGDPVLVREVVNRWLYHQRQALENGSRLALLYPMAFFKLAPAESTDVFERVRVRALEPWNVIVDRDADLWDEQRYVGHRYYLPIHEARAQFGNKKYRPVQKRPYFDVDVAKQDHRTSFPPGGGDLPDEYLYLEIVELYDLQYDRLYIWTPNWANGEKLLLDERIPVRDYDDEPIPAICPLYYSRQPDRPMDGYSSLARVYDQLLEKNVIRTFQANAIRRDSRQFLYREGAVDEESLAKITAGVDGAMIPVDAESLDGVIREVPVGTMSSNFDRYLSYVESDLQRGSVLSPNNFGEATRATATEITALAQYSASQIGRLARDRDEMIERLGKIYVRMLLLQVEEGERAVVTVDDMPRIVSPIHLEGRFRMAALDQAATPISDSLKRQQLLQLIPVLTGLGVDPRRIRDEVVRMFNLPPTFLEEPQAEPGAGLRTPAEVEQAPEGPGGAQELAAALLERGGS